MAHIFHIAHIENLVITETGNGRRVSLAPARRPRPVSAARGVCPLCKGAGYFEINRSGCVGDFETVTCPQCAPAERSDAQ